MTRTTKHFFGALTAVLLAVGLAALVLMTIAASAGAQPAEAQPPMPGGPDALTKPLKFVTADSPPSSTANRTYKAVAQCPPFYLAISGGFDLHLGADHWRIRASRPATPEEANAQTAWVAEAVSARRVVNPFTAYAVCVHESLVPRGDSLYYTSDSGKIPGNSNSTSVLTPGCGSHRAIGGGFSFGSENLWTRLVRTQPNPGSDFRSWIVAARNNDPSSFRPPPQDMTAYAVCIRDDLWKDRAFIDTPSSGKGVINSNTTPCPANTYLLSGGGGTGNNNAEDILWSHIRPGGGSEADPPKAWSSGAIDARYFKVSNIAVHAHALCGRLGSKSLGSADGEKASGNNPGWGDGEGGGRSKEEDASGGR